MEVPYYTIHNLMFCYPTDTRIDLYEATVAIAKAISKTSSSRDYPCCLREVKYAPSTSNSSIESINAVKSKSMNCGFKNQLQIIDATGMTVKLFCNGNIHFAGTVLTKYKVCCKHACQLIFYES